jgi:hypothetical protein
MFFHFFFARKYRMVVGHHVDMLYKRLGSHRDLHTKPRCSPLVGVFEINCLGTFRRFPDFPHEILHFFFARKYGMMLGHHVAMLYGR